MARSALVDPERYKSGRLRILSDKFTLILYTLFKTVEVFRLECEGKNVGGLPLHPNAGVCRVFVSQEMCAHGKEQTSLQHISYMYKFQSQKKKLTQTRNDTCICCK